MSADKAFSSWEEAVVWLRGQPEKEQLVKDCYYDDPLIDAAERYWQSDEWAAVQEFLDIPARGKALDVGAGRGIASYALARENLDVTALEPDTSALVGSGAIRSLSRESHLPIQVKEAFSESLPFDDNEFHLVFARAVLHHSQDLGKACKEFYRVLKPGGRLVAIREHVISRDKDLPLFLDQHPLHTLYGGEHAYLLDQYVSAIKHSGFLKVKVISPWKSPVNYAPYSLKTLKQEIARRASKGLPGVGGIVNIMLNLPGVWPFLRQILGRVDQRPGRLYSFIAEKI